MPKRNRILILLAALAILAYLPTLSQPLLEDDYPNIGDAHGLGVHIIAHPILGVRSTSYLLMDAIYRVFGITPAAYYTVLILLHIVNTWLVYALGYWKPIGYTVSSWAAAFFAIYEGHQEGIMWVSAAPEPLLFLFGAVALLCWVRFLYERRWAWYVASLIAFVPALYSKESAFIWVPLLALPIVFARTRWRQALWLIPFAILAALSVAHVMHTRVNSFRFNDGSFSLNAPFWLTWPISFARLFWIWGLVAVLVLLLWRPSRYATMISIGILWAGLALIPYSFLTYSTHIPSRQTYLASAGVALIVGCALAALSMRYWHKGSAIVVAVCALVLIHNVGYLWTKKRAQFLERARPTEQLIALVRSTKGPVYVQCFPESPLIGNWAVELSAGRKDLIWDPSQRAAAAATFCYVRK